MQAEQPVVAGPSTTRAQSSLPSGSETETDATSDELEEDENSCLAPREWNVIKICKRRDHILRGVDEYQVRWARTRHATAEFRISTQRGRLRVKLEGKSWVVIRHVETPPEEQAGEPETVIEWANTWHTIWELPSALGAIVDFEVQNPRLAKQLLSKSKPDLRSWPLYLLLWLDPEHEPHADHSDRHIEGDDFELEAGVDYTASLLRHFRQVLRAGGKLPSPAIAMLLCMPVRQRMVFRDGYVRETITLTCNTKIWRALAVYVVGLAHRQRCSHCLADGADLAFPKCVSWGGIFADACVNCVIAGSKHATSCECRIGQWTWKNNARQMQQPETETNAEGAQSASPDEERQNSIGAQSSTRSDDIDDGFTPPSERSSPSRDGEQESSGRRSASAELREALQATPDRLPGQKSIGAELVDIEAASEGKRRALRQQLESSADSKRNTDERTSRLTHGRFGAWSANASSAGSAILEDTGSGNDASFDGISASSEHPGANDDIQDEHGQEPRTAELGEDPSERQVDKRPVGLCNDANGDALRGSESKRPRHENTTEARRRFKSEQTPSSTQAGSASRLPHIDTSHHTLCSEHPNRACVDPEVGAPPERPYDRFDPPPGVVYAHQHRWEDGTLDDDNVEFIMSFCPCAVTQYLQDAWTGLVRAEPNNQGLSRYAVLSRVYTEELNRFIQMYCPGQPQAPGEVIELE